METIGLIILAYMFSFVVYNALSICTGKLAKQAYHRYLTQARELANNIELHADIKELSTLSRERAALEVLTERFKRHDVAIFIGKNIDALIVGGATVLLLNSGAELSFDTLSKVGFVALVLLVIRLMGCSSHWRGPIFGQSIFAVLFIESTINILLAFFSGLLLAVAF